MLWTSVREIVHIDMLSILMICLVSFIGSVVGVFSKTYMQGDILYRRFFSNILILLISVILMSMADNLILFLSAWCYSNWILATLIVHKSSWKAAEASGRLALKNFIVGCSFLAVAFALLSQTTGSFSITYIIQNAPYSWCTVTALMFLLIAAMTQSAIWPFHRWLISSPNSPTPVSALMHAGMVNGGGFLLARFAPLYFNAPKILSIIFVSGLISALVGSLWKLMQHDVKRMLACSTMGQMGFMFVQLGSGLFAPALAHLCWHGMFKAYLFLASGSSAQEKRVTVKHPLRLISFLFSLGCGALGSIIFVIINNKNRFPSDSSLIIIEIVFILGAQLALTVLDGTSFKKFPLALMVTVFMTGLYATNVYFFDCMLSPLKLLQPQPLTAIHIMGLIAIMAAWIFMLLAKYLPHKVNVPHCFLRLYVRALNSSQPDPATITSHRNAYDYKEG